MISAALFLLFAVGCTVLGFVRHPIYAFYFYLGSIYVFPPARWWGYIFGDVRWALLSAAITALAIVVRRDKLAPKPTWILSAPAIVMTLYAVWMWIQLPWAVDTAVHLDGSTQFVKYILTFWFVYRIADTKERVRDVLLAHMMGCALLGLFAYSIGRSGDRLDGVGGPGMDDSNTLGMYLATGALTALGLLLTQTGWRRWASLVAGAIIMEGLVLTNTRGAFLGLVGGALVMLVFKARAHRRVFWGLTLVSLVGLAVIVDRTFVERMMSIRESTVDSEDVDQSARSRMFIMSAQWQMFLNYPMGAGHRGTAALSRQYLDDRWLTKADSEEDRARSSHNTFMTTLVEQGIPGALLFVWLTLWTLWSLVRLRSLDRKHGDPVITTLGATVGAVLAAIFVAGNTADFLMAEVQFWMFAAFVSLLQIGQRAVREPGSTLVAAGRGAGMPALTSRRG
ncbi:MAG TPA: O-antigen ligase family protein [Burkholderiaceae bacterium]|nr:O-antigen ligase family protein [Burkholderiaceae bacterium]